MPTLTARSHLNFFFKMENSIFTLFLDELSSLWNNAIKSMNYWPVQQEHAEQCLFLTESMQPFSTATNLSQ